MPAEIVVRSAEMRAVLSLVSGVARTLTPVLVTGETGTGKELLARAIHQMSPRKTRPLVRVNCGALPATLIESELFGHERGAFTGASERRIGRFELADGGTLFLDEIGELPLDLQSKLLRAVQEGEFERVGGSKTLRVSARVIAATNRDLAAAVSAGTFRADLYYRLNVFPVTIPPLRDRVSDIAPLAQAALRRAAQRVGRTFDEIPEHVHDALRNYRWPGNVRELQNVIERAVLLSRELDADAARRLGPHRHCSDGAAAPTPVRLQSRPITASQLSCCRCATSSAATSSESWNIPDGGSTARTARPPSSR